VKRKKREGADGWSNPVFSCITEISTIPRGNLGRIRFSYDMFGVPFLWREGTGKLQLQQWLRYRQEKYRELERFQENGVVE
jgi:hypothetical protein